MENKTNFCSCRLAANHETGRVRWCVGRERDWQMKVKRLVFVPIILLPLVICIVFITRYVIVPSETKNDLITMKQFDESESLEDEEKREVLRDSKTSYVPEIDVNTSKIQQIRPKRDLYTWNVENLTDFDNDTDSYEYMINFDKTDLDWKMLPENNADQNFDSNNKSTINLTKISSDKIFFWKNKLTYNQIRELQAHTMKQYMNESAEPCENFYEYACGNWEKYHSIPADRTSYDTFEMLRENLDTVLKDILTETTEEEELYLSNVTIDINITKNLDAVSKAKFFYNSCLNEDRLNQLGSYPLLKLLEDLGGWPMISKSWNNSNFDFEFLMGKLKLFNNDILITEWVGPDIINSKYYIVQIDQTTLGLPGRAYFLDSSYTKYLNAYKEFISSVAIILGGNSTEVARDIEDLIDFETKLAMIMVPSENRSNVTDFYFRTSITALNTYFPQFDWLKYFQIIIDQNVSPNEEIVCYCMDYLYRLFKLAVEQTKPRTIANYLLWRFVKHRANNMDTRFMIAKQRFYKVLFGREKSPPRWQFCVSQVNSNMGMALGSLFIQKYFDESSKNDTLDMTKKIQQAFRFILNENKWLGNETKDYARLKINRMNLKIGYPDFLLNKTELNKQYSNMNIHPHKFFENILSILRHLTKTEKMKLGKSVDRTTWGTAPAVVNAYYSRNKNQIIFPAGILQPPFYHQYFPKSLNFGGIGVVIGHEITHGFDDKGRLFDQYGNLQQWWMEESIFNFHKRAKCIIDQYNSYIIPDVHTFMDGVITQGENIADNGGLKQAFRAYELWLKNNPNADETLPGINLTGEQLFFLNFAQVWCGKQRIDALKSRLKVAVHSPGIFRVIGTLSNSEDFARVFNCPLNSFMNPSEKCSLCGPTGNVVEAEPVRILHEIRKFLVQMVDRARIAFPFWAMAIGLTSFGHIILAPTIQKSHYDLL